MSKGTVPLGQRREIMSEKYANPEEPKIPVQAWMRNKYVISYKKDDELLYNITPEGKRAIELTADMIPGILTLQVDNHLKENLDDIEDKFSISSDYTPIDENHFTVKCKIVENNNIMFEIQTFAGSKEQAKSIVDNWNNKAEDIYPKILELLTE